MAEVYGLQYYYKGKSTVLFQESIKLCRVYIQDHHVYM